VILAITSLPSHLSLTLRSIGNIPLAQPEISASKIENFKLSLRAHSWNTTYSSNSASKSFDNFWQDFYQNFNNHFPLCTFSSNKNTSMIKNFLTPELLEARKRKLSLHKLALSDPSPFNIYYETNLANSCNNPKKTWQLLKEAANLDSACSPITELNVNGTLTSDNSLIANSFNTFFSTVGSTISNSIPPTSVNPLDYCTKSPDIRNLEFAGTGPCQVGDTIKIINGKYSTDLDGVSTKLLKAVRAEIESPLAHIFNLSLTTGEFPHKLKASKVIPIHKAGDHTNSDNYRPITLVNAFSKILEK
jgi:hypothetical protein